MGCGELDLSCQPLLQSAGRLQMGALAGSRTKERGRGQPSEGVSQTESLDSIPQEVILGQSQIGGVYSGSWN